MKHTICIIACTLVLLCLCACEKTGQSSEITAEPSAVEERSEVVSGEDIAEEESAPERSEMPVEETPLLEFDLSTLGGIVPIAVDSNEQYAALLYYSVEGIDMTAQPQYLALLDLRCGEVIGSTGIDATDFYPNRVEITDTGITLTDAYSGRVMIFNPELTDQTEGSCEHVENWEKGEAAGLDIGRFDCRERFALSTSFGVVQSLVFYDAPTQYYMLKYNPYYEYACAENHCLLMYERSEAETEQPETILHILDFENCRELNRVELPSMQEGSQIAVTSMNNRYVSAITLADTGFADVLYVWNYNLEPTNTAFSEGYCEVLDENEIRAALDGVSERVLERYGIVLTCNPELEFLQESKPYENCFDDIYVYQRALELEYYLSLLPGDLYRELLCGDLEDPVASFDALHIYLVGEITDGFTDAYASDIGSEETDGAFVVYIVYSCSGLSQQTFFHEFMHTLEYRIWNYEPDFDTVWETLNPEGFAYDYEGYSDVYYDDANEAWRDYFTRDYGMRSILEDRATCFEVLCDYCVRQETFWWSEDAPLAAKQAYLTEVLEKSFPSLSTGALWQQAVDMSSNMQ